MWLRIAIIAIAGLAFLLGDVALADEPVSTRLPVQIAKEGTALETVIVERGDHLWKISEEHLESVGAAVNLDIAPYWREVIDLNLPSLRSGDADLIFPGEVVELPPVSARR